MFHFRLHLCSLRRAALAAAALCCVSSSLAAQGSTSSAPVTPSGAEPRAAESAASEDFEGFLPVQPTQSGFQLGLGSGVSWPFGNADGGSDVAGIAWRSGELSGVVQLRVPISVEAGYRINPHWWVGAIPELSFGSYGDECIGPEGACEFTDFRVLAGATWYPLGFSTFSPWLRLALGYEWLRATLELEDGFSGSETLGGPLAQLQLGVDWQVGESFAFGPYLAAAAGSYLSSTFKCQPATCPTDSGIEEHGVHGWISIGLRGTHGP